MQEPAAPTAQTDTWAAGHGNAGPVEVVTPRPARAPGRRRARWRVAATAWAFMTPVMTLLLLMTVVPTIYLVWASFHSKTLLGGTDAFVGLDNYKNVLSDPEQWRAFLHTAFFVVVAVVAELGLGLLLAVPLAAQTRSNNIATTLLLLPFAVTPVVSALIFKELLNPSTGWIDHYMGVLGLPAHVEWLSDPKTAWLALLGLDVWQWTPFVALILMAGLQAMPIEPKEAAAIDGASAWQTFRHISLPMLSPFIAIALVLRTIQAFKTFDSFSLLTNGGPGTSTEVVNLQIYRVALQSFRIGAAAATAMLLLLVLLALTPLLLRFAGRNAEPEAT